MHRLVLRQFALAVRFLRFLDLIGLAFAVTLPPAAASAALPSIVMLPESNETGSAPSASAMTPVATPRPILFRVFIGIETSAICWYAVSSTVYINGLLRMVVNSVRLMWRFIGCMRATG